MYSYSVNDKQFVINALTLHDVMSGELFSLDKLYYPPSIVWTKSNWIKLLNSAQYKLALREVSASGSKLIGNLVVCLVSGKHSKHEYETSYSINSLTIHIHYLRQGHAKRLVKVLAEQISAARESSTLESAVKNISVSLPRSVPLLSNIAMQYGFEGYAVEANAIRYSMPIQDFLQNANNKTAMLTLLDETNQEVEKEKPVKESPKFTLL